MRKNGFTLIELIIVVAIIAILAGIVVIALNPLLRFRTTRDAARNADVNQFSEAIALNALDAGGFYVWAIRNVATGTDYMISSATTSTGCSYQCTNYISSTGDCINLNGLIQDGHIGQLPVAPSASSTKWDSIHTGYYFTKNSNNTITVGSCESENGTEIKAVR